MRVDVAWRCMAPALAVALIVALAAAGAALAGEPKASFTDIEDEVMCPICGTALNLSGSNQADRERVFIRSLIDEGKTKDEIKDALVAEYGPDVLAVPETEGFDLAAWILPGAGILVAAVAVAVGVRRWRRAGGGRAATSGTELSDDDERRLDADLARYEL